MGLLYDMDLPDENMYGEVTDEMIDNAPSSEVRSALERCRKNREVWLRGSWSKFNQENEYYHFYMEAEKGNKRGAYSYLREATKSLEELDISRAI